MGLSIIFYDLNLDLNLYLYLDLKLYLGKSQITIHKSLFTTHYKNCRVQKYKMHLHVVDKKMKSYEQVMNNSDGVIK